MSEIDRLVADYVRLHPAKAPRIDGRCCCGLTAWAHGPCVKCGGFCRDRLREVLLEGEEQKESRAC